jgi:hypothetical protein
MSDVARPRKSVTVTVLGLMTLLLGGAYTALGSWFVFAGVDWLEHPSKDPWVQTFALGGLVPAFIVLIGLGFLMPGFLGLLAGSGVLMRKQWGRILTFMFAVPVILLGLLWVSGVQDAVQDSTVVVVGATQILYGILAFVTLIMNRAEFSWNSKPSLTTRKSRLTVPPARQ